MAKPLGQFHSCLLAEVLTEATACLQHLPSAQLDAQWLLAFVIDKDPVFLRAWPAHRLNDKELLRYQQLIQRRSEGEPLAYVLGTWEFWSLPLKVSPHTLIPRPETELLVELALSLLPSSSQQVADLGTGSGAIALALAKERPLWQLWATDVSTEALAVAQENAQTLQLNNVRFCLGDWTKALPAGQLFDMLVSNPPYIAPDDPHLRGDGVCFEPKSALVADQDGLADLESIIRQAKTCLRPGGYVLLEHGYGQGEAVRACFESAAYRDIQTHSDWSGRDRVSLACT